MSVGLGESLPGVALLAAVALTAHLLGGAVSLLSPLVFAIAIGVVVFNAVDLPSRVETGVALHSLFLETAIVLLGASLSVEAVVAVGPLLVAFVVGVVAFGLVSVGALSRLAGLTDRTGTLLAAGASVCGVSAIAAVAPACDARDSQIAHAAATILLFDAITLVAFPAVGRLLDLDARFYGVWIGLSMFSTGPVAAAGFAHSAAAGRWATMTKLARNSLIGVVAVWYSLRGGGDGGGAPAGDHSVGRVWSDFPKFLVGFVALAALTNVGLLPAAAVDAIRTTSDALFLLAFAGLGAELRFDEIRAAGAVPFAVVGAYLLLGSGVAYGLVSLLF